MSIGVKPTYRASTAAVFAAAASTSPFFVIQGSATKTLIIQRVMCSGHSLTAVEYLNILAQKTSTAVSGGTPVALTQVPVDSGSAAGTANLVNVYTAAPTGGSVVGTLAARRVLGQATTPAAGGAPAFVEFDFRVSGSENTGVYLRGVAQGVHLAFSSAPATAVTMLLSVEWVEIS